MPWRLSLAALLLPAFLLVASPGCGDEEDSGGGPPVGGQQPRDDGGASDLGPAELDQGTPQPDLGTPDLGEPDLGDPRVCRPAGAVEDGPVGVRYEPDGPFFGRPFPDDLRRDAEGHLELEGFPNPTNSPILTQIIGLIEQQTPGWSANAAAYVTFDGPIFAGSLPADRAATLLPDAGDDLAPLHADGELGDPVPLVLQLHAEGTLFLPPHTLAAMPVPGFPLVGGQRYALVVSTEVLDAECQQLAPASGPLAERIAAAGLSAEGVAGAAVFTPQDVLEPLLRIRDAVDALPPAGPIEIHHEATGGQVELYQGLLPVPNFQAGEPPYLAAGSGGNFVWEGDEPVVQRTEEVRFSLTVPRNEEMPPNGWPWAIYAHGTGGDYESVFNGPAQDLAVRGIAAVGYDQVLHGPRDPTDSPVELTFFNVLNMPAGRDNVLQGGVDALAVQRALEGFELDPEQLEGGAAGKLDPARVVFVGHSQGGITGAPFVAMGTGLSGALFSGTAGLLTITILERDDLEFEVVPGADTYKDMVEHLLEIRGVEELDRLHPVLTLMQTFIEPADTINYAPAFHARAEAARAVPVLVLEGFRDPYSPANGIEAFALAAHTDLVEPVGRTLLGHELLGRAPLTPPVQGNWHGVTAGLSQYPLHGHFPLFDDVACRVRSFDFVAGSLGGDQPTIR